MDTTTITFEATPETAQFIKQLVYQASKNQHLTDALRLFWQQHEAAELQASLTHSWEAAEAGHTIEAEALREKLTKKYSAMIS